tara:strand:- start:2534 stop:2773 length:240 start_codon:yes stop_codon:yes gene_type:complete
MGKEVFTVQNGADYYGVSKSLIYKLAHYKKVPYSKPNRKTIFFLKEDLDNYFLGNRIEAKPQIDIEAETANYILKSYSK